VVEIEIFYIKDIKLSVGGADGAVDDDFGSDKTCHLGADMKGVVDSVASNCVVLVLCVVCLRILHEGKWLCSLGESVHEG
jgi:hypothetical protein